MSKGEKSELFKIVLGLLFALPIIIGIGSIALEMLKVLFENMGEIVSFILFSLAFFGVLAFLGNLFEGRRSSGSRFAAPLGYPENWNELRLVALARDDHSCGNCASRSELHVHHIVPLSKGGSNNLSNLRTLCRNCHTKLHPHMRD
jgi:hypothetical protein